MTWIDERVSFSSKWGTGGRGRRAPKILQYEIRANKRRAFWFSQRWNRRYTQMKTACQEKRQPIQISVVDRSAFIGVPLKGVLKRIYR
ncbi:MAG: hypothetical protein NTW47_06380, partial [Proteobacteria bacterium]|nr:hypothetical protein [Pseudomonadota bacterium]